MGPLFSAFGIASLGIVVLSVAFVVARLFLPVRTACMAALCMWIGGGIGVAVAVVAAMPVIGVGGTLATSSSVAAYLAALALGGLAAGALSVWAYLRRHKANAF